MLEVGSRIQISFRILEVIKCSIKINNTLVFTIFYISKILYIRKKIRLIDIRKQPMFILHYIHAKFYWKDMCYSFDHQSASYGFRALAHDGAGAHRLETCKCDAWGQWESNKRHQADRHGFGMRPESSQTFDLSAITILHVIFFISDP